MLQLKVGCRVAKVPPVGDNKNIFCPQWKFPTCSGRTRQMWPGGAGRWARVLWLVAGPYYPTVPTHALCSSPLVTWRLCWRGWAARGRGQRERSSEAAAGWAEVRAAAERPTAWLLTRPVEATRHSVTAPQPLCDLLLSSTLRHHPSGYYHTLDILILLLMKSDSLHVMTTAVWPVTPWQSWQWQRQPLTWLQSKFPTDIGYE